MEKRQITMQDGRYLIFYAFAESSAPSTGADAKENQKSDGSAPEPEAKPEAEEERRV